MEKWGRIIREMVKGYEKEHEKKWRGRDERYQQWTKRLRGQQRNRESGQVQGMEGKIFGQGRNMEKGEEKNQNRKKH